MSLGQVVFVVAVLIPSLISLGSSLELSRSYSWKDGLLQFLLLSALTVDAFIWGLLFSSFCQKALTAAGFAVLALGASWFFTGILAIAAISLVISPGEMGGRADTFFGVAAAAVRVVVSGGALWASWYVFCRKELVRASATRAVAGWHVLLWLSFRQGKAAAILKALDIWLAQHGPRKELLRRALEELSGHEAQTPPAAEYVKSEYIVYRNTFASPSQLFFPSAPNSQKNAMTSLELQLMDFSRQVPWEWSRTRRHLNSFFNEMLEFVNSDYWSLHDRFGIVTSKPRSFVERKLAIAELVKNDNMLRSMLFLDWFRHSAYQTFSLSRLRGARLKIALALYQIDHGGKPASTLEDLVPDYLRELPVDPFSGRLFGYRVSQGESIHIETRALDDTPAQKVTAGQGIVWSIGPDLADQGGTKQGIDLSPTDSHWTELGLDVIFFVPQWPKAEKQ